MKSKKTLYHAEKFTPTYHMMMARTGQTGAQ